MSPVQPSLTTRHIAKLVMTRHGVVLLSRSRSFIDTAWSFRVAGEVSLTTQALIDYYSMCDHARYAPAIKKRLMYAKRKPYSDTHLEQQAINIPRGLLCHPPLSIRSMSQFFSVQAGSSYILENIRESEVHAVFYEIDPAFFHVCSASLCPPVNGRTFFFSSRRRHTR